MQRISKRDFEHSYCSEHEEIGVEMNLFELA